jgi:anti-sigma factor ChrR (cupin superfamily)
MTPKKNKMSYSPPRARSAPLLGTSAVAPLATDVAQLALVAPLATPSPQVKAQLLARIRASKVSVAKATPSPLVGWRFESASETAGWRETFPGVRFKTLSVDDARDLVMLMVEMKPGARFPDHPHDDTAEDGLVISGDVQMGDRLMQAGDYYHAEPGTVHVDVSSPSGCTALLSLRASAWRRWRETMVAR